MSTGIGRRASHQVAEVCHVTVEEDKLDAKFDTKLSNFQAEVTLKTINE